ncbi:hypothetical protein ACB092_02G116300 [Castanea dentata]
MSTLKFIAKLPKSFPTEVGTSRRVFVTAAPRPLQSKKDEESVNASVKTKEAAEAVTEGAKEVRKTCEFVTDTARSTAESVAQMTQKVGATAEDISQKTKGTVEGVWGTAKNATEIIKDKVMGK